MLAGRHRASAPFCETTGRWAQEVEVPVQFELIAEPEVVRHRLQSGPEHILAVLVPRAEGAAGSFAALTLYRCPGVHSFITIKNFIEMAPETVPLPAEVRNLMVAMPDKVECFAEAEEPVVELLRLSIPDPDALLRLWANAADSLSTDTKASHFCAVTPTRY